MYACMYVCDLCRLPGATGKPVCIYVKTCMYVYVYVRAYNDVSIRMYVCMYIRMGLNYVGFLAQQQANLCSIRTHVGVRMYVLQCVYI
jgi:hypothetical protein